MRMQVEVSGLRTSNVEVNAVKRHRTSPNFHTTARRPPKVVIQSPKPINGVLLFLTMLLTAALLAYAFIKASSL